MLLPWGSTNYCEGDKPHPVAVAATTCSVAILRQVSHRPSNPTGRVADYETSCSDVSEPWFRVCPNPSAKYPLADYTRQTLSLTRQLLVYVSVTFSSLVMEDDDLTSSALTLFLRK